MAGHSQGSVLAARLLRERIATSAERERLVVAYLIGAPLEEHDLGGFDACRTPSATECVVTFNARGPKPARHPIELKGSAAEHAHLRVNPRLGRASSEAVPRSRHGGALFFDADDPLCSPRSPRAPVPRESSSSPSSSLCPGEIL